jgi:nucleoside 2-deoxyribosyltransferase
MNDTCYVCSKSTAVIHRTNTRRDNVEVECPRCGNYEITRRAYLGIEYLTAEGTQRYLLAGVIRASTDREKPLLLTTDNIPELMRSAKPPRNPLEAIDRLLLHILDTVSSPASYVRIMPGIDDPLVFARDGNELSFYLSKARELGYIECYQDVHFRLDLEGWSRVDQLRRTRTISDQAFVAMWFSPEMLDVWTHGVRPALEATGYRPMRLDMEEHNDKVDDRIIAEIRRSALVVADFSGDRSNVYFEAGFALGLGIPVIWTCRESDVPGLHFDTRQYNYISWSDPADLKAKLQLRIEATIPSHPAAQTHA